MNVATAAVCIESPGAVHTFDTALLNSVLALFQPRKVSNMAKRFNASDRPTYRESVIWSGASSNSAVISSKKRFSSTLLASPGSFLRRCNMTSSGGGNGVSPTAAVDE